MIMGIVSFVTYVFFSSSEFRDSSTSAGQWFEGFHYGHIVAFFIAIAYIVQAILFILSINNYGSKLQKFEFTNPVEIIHCHEALKESKTCWYFNSYHYFREGPIWLHFFIAPKYDLTFTMQIQLISQYFKRKNNLPSSFNFATYVNRMHRNYVMSLVEVSPLTWILLSALVAFNYIKISVDAQLGSLFCNLLNDTNEEINSSCPQYEMISIIGYAIVLDVYALLLLGFTVLTFRRLLSKVLPTYAIADDAGERKSGRNGSDILKRYLSTVGKELSDDNCIVDAEYNKGKAFSFMVNVCNLELDRSLSQHSLVRSLTQMKFNSHTKSQFFIKRGIPQLEMGYIEWLRGKVIEAVASFLSWIRGDLYEDFNDPRSEEFRALFLFSQPYALFSAIETGLLLQCVYFSLWATQYAIMAARMSGKDLPGLWEVIIVIPLILSIYLFHTILFYSSLLKSIAFIDHAVVKDLMEEAHKRHKVHEQLRTLIKDKLSEGESMTEESLKRMRHVLIAKFKSMADSNGEMDLSRFSKFMNENFGGNSESFDAGDIRTLFKSVDVDNSGKISWAEIVVVVFPFKSSKEYAYWEAAHCDIKRETSAIRSYAPSYSLLNILAPERAQAPAPRGSAGLDPILEDRQRFSVRNIVQSVKKIEFDETETIEMPCSGLDALEETKLSFEHPVSNFGEYSSETAEIDTLQSNEIRREDGLDV